jgi:hypothetical protein
LNKKSIFKLGALGYSREGNTRGVYVPVVELVVVS